MKLDLVEGDRKSRRERERIKNKEEHCLVIHNAFSLITKVGHS